MNLKEIAAVSRSPSRASAAAQPVGSAPAGEAARVLMTKPAYAGPERRSIATAAGRCLRSPRGRPADGVRADARARRAPAPAFVGAGLFGAALSLVGATPWRRVFIGCGFPLSFAASGASGGVSAWAWLLPLVLLASLYPRRTWRDAPLFPTPRGALAGLSRHAPLASTARALDAGCGLGAASSSSDASIRRVVEASNGAADRDRVRAALPLRESPPRRPVGRRLVALRARLPLPAAEAMAPRRRQGRARARRRRMARQPRVRDRGWVPEHVLDGAAGRRVWLYRAPFRRAAPEPLAAGRYRGVSRPCGDACRFFLRVDLPRSRLSLLSVARVVGESFLVLAAAPVSSVVVWCSS